MQLTTRRARGYDVRTRSRIAGLGEGDSIGPIVELATPQDYVNFFEPQAPMPAKEPSFLEQAGTFIRDVFTPVAQVGTQYLTTRAQIDAARSTGTRIPGVYTQTGQPVYSGSPYLPGPTTAAAQPFGAMNPMLILGIGASVLLISTLVMQRRK